MLMVESAIGIATVTTVIAGRERYLVNLRNSRAFRIRPKMMTVAVIIAGLLPIMFSQGDGADTMKRIAAPLVGGMLSAPLISLFLLPVLYMAWVERTRR